MSIPGGITIPPDARTDYKIGNTLPNLIAQVLDSFTFNATHEPDVDFKAQQRSKAAEAERMREEQRTRINMRYNGISQPSPDYVQRELLFLYRGEAASVDLAKESNGKDKSVIDTASDDAVRTLKKEMKQKIHEWEGSFKVAYSKEAGPQDKAILRPVYEVYKVAKNRITPSDALPPSGPSSAAASTDSRPSSAKGPAHQPQQPPQPAPAHPPGRPTATTATVTSSAPNVAVPVTSTAPLPATTASTVAQPPTPAPTSTLPLAKRISQEEAAVEKRKLKRKLHQFESDFEKKHGRPPQREDRKEFSSEYARYAELKALLNEK